MRRFQLVVAGITVGVWTISLLDGLVTRDYQGADIATPVAILALGFVFGDSFLRRRYLNGENGDR